MSKKNNKCNILFISHVSSKEYGGAELVLDNIINGIDHNKFNSTFLLQKTLDNVEDLGWDCSSKANIKTFDFGSLSHKSKIIGLLGMFYRMIKGFFYIGYLIKKNNIDVVCANSLIAATFSVMPSRFLRKRFFYYEHNITDQRKGHLIGIALQPVSILATDIVCISKSVKESLEREGVPASKLHLVYNGYDFTTLDVSTSIGRNLPLRHQLNILQIGMVANYMPWKRHQLFLEIISDLSKKIPSITIEATIVGGCLPGNEEYYNEIFKWVENYEGNVRFTLTGFQDNVTDYFRSFDILINPAKAEPFGLIFIEAMYLECVVVGSIEGAAPEIINDGVTGYIVDYDDRENTLQRLSELAVNTQKRIDIGIKASKLVKDDFSIEKQVKKLERLFIN